jgi:putative DNA primase/helicase
MTTNGQEYGEYPPPPVTDEFVQEMRAQHSDVAEWPIKQLLNHSGNAARFAEFFGKFVRYTVGRGWMVWDGKRWSNDINNARVNRYMQEIARYWYEVAEKEQNEKAKREIERHASRTLQRDGIDNSLIQASRITSILTSDSAFDANPWLLCVQNGIVNLQTGELLSHDPSYMCSRIAGVDYDPKAQALRWESFNHEIFAGDKELVEFARRWDGYCLTGETREQRYMIAWGSGANGKTTRFEVLRYVMGDYAINIRPLALVARIGNTNDTNPDVAKMPGVRLAICSEWQENMLADESLLKSLTGQDTVTVRTLYRNPFEFKPVAKIVIYGNNKPNLNGTDAGTWRRPLLLPFEVQFLGNQRDNQLIDKLRNEGVGILAALVRGCLEWQQNGLKIPKHVQDATEAYRIESNDVLRFLEECCIKHQDARATVGELLARYVKWGGSAHTAKKFGFMLRSLGFETKRTARGFEVLGIGLAEQ